MQDGNGDQHRIAMRDANGMLRGMQGGPAGPSPHLLSRVMHTECRSDRAG